MRRRIVICLVATTLILGGCARMSEFKALLDDVNRTLLSIAVLTKAN